MALVMGTESNDTLNGTAGSDVINGLGGADIIRGSEGIDFVDGGSGIDRLSFTPFASSGGGVIIVSDTFVRDTAGRINTSFANVEGFTFNNTNRAALTIDASLASTSGVRLTLAGGATPAAEASRLTGGAGNDIISVSGERVIVDAGAGLDNVTVGLSGYVRAMESAGTFTLLQNGVSTDVITSITNAETLRLSARSALDYVFFDASALKTGVELSGGVFSDYLIGGSGADRLEMVGQTYDWDHLIGNAGADTYYATSFRRMAAETAIHKIESVDRISFSAVSQVDLVPASFIGRASFGGIAGQYRSAIVDGETIIEIDLNGDAVADGQITIEGRAFTLHETATGSNVLEIDATVGQRVGTYGADVLVGTASSEFLFGHQGDDRLDGGAGADLLEGDAGNDTLRGGSGADVFLFDYENDDTGQDRILDFGKDDVLVVPGALRDKDGDGIISFGRDRTLDLSDTDADSGDYIQITTAEGGRLTALEYDGFVEIAGLEYYVYSRVGSAAGVGTLKSNPFFDQLG